MNLVRKCKVNKLTNQPLTGIDKEAIDYIQTWIKELLPLKWGKIPDDKYYMSKEGEYVFHYNSEVLWVRYSKFNKDLKNRYGIYSEESSILFISQIKEVLKIQPLMICSSFDTIHETFEELFKNKKLTN